MKLVYTHENRLMVLNVGLAPIDTWPEVWVVNDDDFESSMKIIESLEDESQKEIWQCRECLEMNDESFDYCWNCKRDKS